MTEGLKIPENHHDTVWVFRVNLPEAEAEAFNKENHTDGGEVIWPMREALGIDHLDHDFIELFNVSTLDEYGFTKYLTDANGISDDALEADQAKLDALDGMIVLVFSSALGSDASRFTPREPLEFIGRYGGGEFVPPFVDMENVEPEGALNPPPPPSTEKLGGSWIASIIVAMIAALILLLVFVL